MRFLPALLAVTMLGACASDPLEGSSDDSPAAPTTVATIATTTTTTVLAEVSTTTTTASEPATRANDGRGEAISVTERITITVTDPED